MIDGSSAPSSTGTRLRRPLTGCARAPQRGAWVLGGCGWLPRCCAWLLGVCAWLLVSHSNARADELPRMLWGPAAELRSLPWPATKQPSGTEPWQVYDPDAEVTLPQGRVLLVPVRQGDIVEISADSFVPGFVYGSLELPDAIVWHAAETGRAVIRVPTWGYARFVGVRVEAEQSVRVRVAVPVRDQLAFHRLDAEIQEVLADPARPTPVLPDGEGQDLLDALVVQRNLVFEAVREVPEPRRGELERAAVRWLAARWLAGSYLIRPLLRPFFLEEPVVVGGASGPVELDAEGKRWYSVGQGQTLTFAAERADVLRLAISVWAGQDARYQILEGDELVSEQVRIIPERSMIEERWTPPKSSRVVLRGGATTRIVVLAGRLKVATKAVAAQVALFEPGDLRSPSALLDGALQEIGAGAEPTDQLLRLLVLDERLRSAKSGERLHRLLETETRVPLRALLWSVLLPRFSEQRSVAEQLLEFWEAAASAPPEQATALREWVLGRIHAARDVPPVEPEQHEPLRAHFLAGIAQMEPSRALTHRALVELILPPTDGLRPATAAALEERSASTPFRADFRRLARTVWRRVSPWTTLDPDDAAGGELRWQTPLPKLDEQLCDIEGPVGLRWTRLGAEPQRFEIAPSVGTHTSVPFRPLPADDGEFPDDSKVSISGEPLSVLVVPGRTSRVLLAKGAYDFSVSRGPPVVARVPRSGQAPCETLLESRRWYQLGGRITVPLPPGDTPTLASLVVEPDSVPEAGAQLRLRIGKVEHHAEIRRPATGALEIAVAPGETELEIESAAPLFVRVRIRQHRTGLSPGTPEKTSSERELRLVKLERLRQLARDSRKLDSVETLSELRTRRAQLLLELGHRRLSAADAARRVEGAPPITPLAVPPTEVWLPHRDEAVIAATRASRLPLMPPDLPPEQLRQVNEQLLLRQDEAALSLLESFGAARTRGRGAQTMALSLEDAGKVDAAAKLYEALSEAVPAAENFAAAAEMTTLLAQRTQSLELTERAHFLARQATALGAREVQLLAPLSGTVRWQAPSLSSLGQGAVRVDVRGQNPRAHSEASQLRAALVDMPDESRWLSDQSALNVFSLRGKRVRISSLCFFQEGPLEACEVRLSLDGKKPPCDPEKQAPVADARLATRPRSCEFVVPDDARRLRLRLPPEGDPTGYYVAEELGAKGPVIVPSRHSFARVSPEAPLEIQVMAPTVVRLRARARGEEPAALDVLATASVLGSEPPGEVLGAAQRWRVELFPEGDPYASWPGSDAAVQYEMSEFIVVQGRGLRTLVVTPTRSGVLVKPELPVTVQAPAPPEAETEESVASAGPPPPWAGFVFPAPAEPADPVPLTVSADVLVVDRDLAESDVDARDRHVELMVSVRRELLQDRWWAGLGLFNRLRDGPSSFGLDVVSSYSSRGYVPGAFVRTRIAAQELRGGLVVGARSTLGAFEAIDLDAKWSLLPGAALTLRHSDRAMLGRPGSDRDVASVYADDHPLSLDLTTTFAHRPYFDTRGRYGALVRLNPDMTSVDRAQLGARFDWLGGSGWSPWVRWDTTFGYRPSNALRDDAFFRLWTAPSATFWRWLVGAGRLRFEGSLGSYVDIPLRSRPVAFFGTLGVGYDFIGARGLTDHRPLERLHRARLEEGSRKLNTAPPASDSYWTTSDVEGGGPDPEVGE